MPVAEGFLYRIMERILYYTGKIHEIHEVRGRDGVAVKMDSMDFFGWGVKRKELPFSLLHLECLSDDDVQVRKKLYAPLVEDKNSHMRVLNISCVDDLVVNLMDILKPAAVDADGNECEEGNWMHNFATTSCHYLHDIQVGNCEVCVEGLETTDYLDNMQNRKSSTKQGDAITFESEVDKIYLRTPTKIAILNHEKKRTFVVHKDGLPDARKDESI